MRAPKPKSAELIQLLTPSLVEGKNLLSEFEVRRILSEAGKLPERYQGFCIEGLLKIVCGQLDEGFELCERALLLAPYDAVSWGNYSRAVGNQALHSKQLEILRRAVKINSPTIYVEAMVSAAFWADMDLLNKVVPMIKDMEISLSASDAKALATYNRLLDYGDDAKEIQAVAAVVMKVAEAHRLPSTISRVGDDGDGLYGFTVVVDTSDPDYIISLNNELFDEIIAANLETSRCIGYFEPWGK